MAAAGVLCSAGAGASEIAGLNVDDLLKRCAPSVHPETMQAILNTESRGNVFAVADAGPVALPWSQRKSMVRSHYPPDKASAVRLVNDLLARGHTVSLGLAQINDRNLAKLGVQVESIFDPCANVAAGASILSSFYASAVKSFGPTPRALRAALSAYNSGSFVRGEKDGYVDLVFRQAGKPLVLKDGGNRVPALASANGYVPASTSAAAPQRSNPRQKRGEKGFTLSITSFDSTVNDQ